MKMKENKRSTVAFPTCLPLKMETIGDIISESQELQQLPGQMERTIQFGVHN